MIDLSKISSLLGWLTVQAHLNPLRPENFARALRETLVLGTFLFSEFSRSKLNFKNQASGRLP